MAKLETYDFVIVGAGSAGCVLANRLTEDPDVTVLVLEAGPPDPWWDWRLHMPAAFAFPLMSRTYNWWYESEPEPHMDNRRIYQPRGRVLGGSSSINGLAYVRGHARDYDRWAQAGLEGWSYAHCLPYFKKAETRALGGDAYRGHKGPLHTSTGVARNPLYQAWIEAGRQAGYPVTDDMNGFQQEGFGRMDSTTRHGKRWSAARGYLHPARRRQNLSVRTGALSLRVAFDRNEAVGVDYAWRGELRRARAGREVICSGGAVNSPQLLMLSGIGPADHLAEHGIDVITDLPGVGRNLQDHLEIYVQHACTQPVSFYPALKPWNKAWIGVLWYLGNGAGPAGSNKFETGGFIRSEAGIEHPNLQYHFFPLAIRYDGKTPHGGHGFQAHVGPMRPTSAGRITLNSADPKDHPALLFNYNATDQDRREMRDAVKLTREVFSQAAFDPYRGDELAPGPDAKTDAEIDAFIRSDAESAYHPCGTCKMGPATDPMAVVDGAGKVYGVERLRVVDASLMPSIVSGNLNAPTIMMAEKLADAIRGKAPPPPSDAPVWIHPEWETRQR